MTRSMPSTSSRVQPLMRSYVGIDIDDAEFGVAQHQCVSRCVENGAVLLFARTHRLFRPLAFGDVARDAQHVRRSEVQERNHPYFEIERRAVAAVTGGQQFGRLSGERAPDQGTALLAQWGRHQFVQGPANDLVAKLAVHALIGRIDVNDPVLRVQQLQRVGGRLENGAVLLLARPQRLHGVFAVGNLAGEGENAPLASDGGRLEHDFVPMQAAVAVATVPLEADHLAALGRLDVADCRLDRVGLFVRADVSNADPQQLLARPAVDPAGRRIDVDNRPGVPVMNEKRILRRLEDRAVTRLGRSQCHFRPLSFEFRRQRVQRRSSAAPRSIPDWRSVSG